MNSHAIFSYAADTTKRLMTTVSLENRFWYPKKSLFFYRSSGENSTHAGTWFPCRGISEEKDLFGWIIKSQGYSDNFYADPAYPEEFLDFVITSFDNETLKFSINARKHQREHPCETFLARFGNIDCLLYSFVIGGGFWKSDDSRTLRQYLNVKYSNEIKKISESCHEVTALRNPTNILKEYNYTFVDVRELNYALRAEAEKTTDRLELDIPIAWKPEERTLSKYLEEKHLNRMTQIKTSCPEVTASQNNTTVVIQADVGDVRERNESVSAETKKMTIEEKSNTFQPYRYTDDDTLVEIGFIIASLGMYAYLKNCVDKREESLSTPTAIAKIALAVLLPPVAMIIGIFSLFGSPQKSDSMDNHIKNNNVNNFTRN